MHLHHLQGVLPFYFAKVTKLLQLLTLQHKSSRLKCLRNHTRNHVILPTYRKHQKRTVQIVYTATKQQISKFHNFYYIPTYVQNKYCQFIFKLLLHVSLLIHCLQTVYSCVSYSYGLLK
jgi:hypothetical protein